MWDAGEIERINDAELVLRGVCQWDELDDMPMALRNDLLAVMGAQDDLKADAARKARGQNRGRRLYR